MVARESTTAVIKNNDICVVSSLKPGEKITAIQINSEKRAWLHETFDDKPVYVVRGECLPRFGFTFTSGEKYFIAYDVQSSLTEHHLLTVELVVESQSNGQIKIR